MQNLTINPDSIDKFIETYNFVYAFMSSNNLGERCKISVFAATLKAENLYDEELGVEDGISEEVANRAFEYLKVIGDLGLSNRLIGGSYVKFIK